MANKKRPASVLIGMRVSRSIVVELDAIVASYAYKHPASPWSRSDALREVLMHGLAPLKARVAAMPPKSV